MKIKKNDKVRIIAGKDKGKTGKVLAVFSDKDKVLVEGVNIVKKHVKKGQGNEEGGIISMEKPIHVSNVMYIDDKSGDPVRLGTKVIDGKKYRISKRTGDVVK